MTKSEVQMSKFDYEMAFKAIIRQAKGKRASEILSKRPNTLLECLVFNLLQTIKTQHTYYSNYKTQGEPMHDGPAGPKGSPQSTTAFDPDLYLNDFLGMLAQ